MAKAVMLQGTGSDVGKTLLVSGLCRAARRRGLRVVPFKPQNMSNNAAVAAHQDGGTGEIGRAQWLQALACGVAPTVDMNPVLIKPHSDTGAQVIVQGRVAGEAGARDYQLLKRRLMDAVMESWSRLREDADLIVVEGAGSPAEINLRDNDIANMGFATRADVPVVLVGDIDRGGVIAALAGTHLILPDEDRRMVAGYLINKFRGDLSLFDNGLSAITRFTGWRSFGVVPWLREASLLPAEDAVVLDRIAYGAARRLKVAVPMLPRIANFDDFDPLRSEPEVEVVFIPPGSSLPGDAGLVIIPGSKATISDLESLRAFGWADEIRAHVARGGHVVGLCGGYQMLGRMVSDPGQIEGGAAHAEGLALLDIETVLEPEKTVGEARGRSAAFDAPVEGYEIHLGRTAGPDCDRPLVQIGQRPDGAMSADGRIMGTYLHGLFNSTAFRIAFLARLGVTGGGFDHRQRVEGALDAIAEQLENSLDVEAILHAAR